MLIDGNSILNRAFYGLSGSNMLKTSSGIYTNAIFGFLNILKKYMDEETPDYLCVAFDVRAKTFRHQEFENYKAQRKGMPDDLAVQFPIMKDILDAMNIKRIEIEGYEGDDIIGTLSKEGEDAGLEVVIVTGDKDSLQLISKTTRVKLPVTRAGKTETEEYTIEKFGEKYGIDPDSFIDVKGLMGDSSDNIPGVAGIGEKTALDLIKQFGSIENIYDRIEEVAKPGIKQKLINDKDMAFLSKRLATIKRDIFGIWEQDQFELKGYNTSRLKAIFENLQFKSMITKFKLENTVSEKGIEAYTPAIIENDILNENESGNVKEKIKLPDDIRILSTIEALQDYKNEIIQAGEIALHAYIERSSQFENKITDIAITAKGKMPVYVELRKSKMKEDFFTIFKDILESESIGKYIHDAKSFMSVLKKNGIDLGGLKFDTMTAAYLCEPASANYEIKGLLSSYLNVDEEDISRGKDKLKEMTLFDIELDKDEALNIGRISWLIFKLSDLLKVMIEENGQDELYYHVEMPLSFVLADMENWGFKVNEDALRQLSDMLSIKLAELEKQIHELAGETFNINSPKQLGHILFEKLGLKSARKTKTGYSTDAEVLEGLASSHEIVAKIVEFRQLSKLKSTYADGLRNVINPITGKIHSNFNQTVTVTGRISSTEPNLQNIPIRLELGREIRKVFIPSSDEYILTDADYSQIELRVLAHISGDENMIDAFNNNEDIHTTTASRVFGVPIDEMTPTIRNRAKAVNFGIVYGIGEFSLAKDLGISRKEAKEYIDGYLSKYAGIKAYMTDTVEKGKADGFVTTLLNRRRYLPELKSSNHNVRAFGERVAMNTPIQGSAADIIKIAMVSVYKALKDGKFKSRLILQVHDELIIETHVDEKDKVERLLKDCMEKAIDLKVPMTVDVKSGRTWFEAH